MKRQRTKCFTGCWTCRSRRVKCDEATPECQRCRQMGVTCGGYGLRLNWVQYDPHDTADLEQDHHGRESSNQQEPRASRRSLAPHSAESSLKRIPSPELDATLTTLDEWRPAISSEVKDGAFSVFTVHSTTPLRSYSNTPAFQNSHGVVDTNHQSEYYVSSAPETIQHEDDIAFVTPAHDFDGVRAHSVPATQSPSYLGGQDRTIPHGSQNSNWRTRAPSVAGAALNASAPVFSLPSLQVDAPQSLLARGRRGQQAPSSHLDALSMPSKQKRLIHHWITFTSRKIVLIDEPHNPCRTMMLPMALKGLVSQADSSNADVAIFHALCASAAYNLFELSGRANEQDRVLALYHDSEAVHHLRHNLARADEHRDQSFAMAIMACIAVEAVSGTTQRWRTHVSGGLAYLAQLQTQGLSEAALSAFRQHMVKMAIMCGFSVPDHLKAFLDDESGASDGLEFTFPYYGVSRSFLRAHDRINSLLADLSDDRTPEQEKELDALELQLYLDFPGLPPHSPSAATTPANGVVIHHTSTAFYYAGLVFFQRSVRRAPIAAVQDLVELGLQELESIDRVGQGALGCLMLWPVLVLGAECDDARLQQRMRAWFHAQRRLGFRNLVVLEDLVATVWKARVENKDEADWRQIIERSQFDVFRL